MRRERAPRATLHALGVGHRRPQADGDVVGEVLATDGDHARVPEAAPLEDREIGGAAADVDERHAEFALVGREHGLGRRDLLEHRVGHRHAGAVHARHDVLRRRGVPGDEVDVHFEPRPGHARRARRSRPGRRPRSPAAATCSISRPLGNATAFAASIARLTSSRLISRLLPGDRHDAAAVEALDVRARQARYTESISMPAVSSASSIARLIESTAASRFTTMPLRMPRARPGRCR